MRNRAECREQSAARKGHKAASRGQRKALGVLRRILCAAVLIGGALLAPAPAHAQDGMYEMPPPAVLFPWPFGHPRMEEGGLYWAGEFKFMKQNNPLRGQPIAYRGLVDFDGSIQNALGFGPGGPGGFIGSRDLALDVGDVSGPVPFQPGFNFVLGWRFRNGVALEFSWQHLTDARYSATASVLPPGAPGDPGQFLQNTFLWSPVFNFPTNYAGPGNQVGIGNVGATFGIWNASSLMTIDFVQRFDSFELKARYPIQQTETWRTYATFGPRIVAMWERFKWRTVAQDVNGVALLDDAANYTNVVSNRLYGVHVGCGNEWYLGLTPIGAWSFSLDLEASLYADFVKGRAKYELGDFSTAASRARNMFTLAPGLQGQINLWWYPYEAIVFRAGYDVMAFFNTVAAPQPIDFNYGALAPAWEKWQTRYLHGLNFGVSVIW